MKKPFLFLSLLVIPALGLLVKGNQTTKEAQKLSFFYCPGKQVKAKATFNREPENKTGRRLTYFWDEQATTQTRL